MLSDTYYAHNYASIIGGSLIIIVKLCLNHTTTWFEMLHALETVWTGQNQSPSGTSSIVVFTRQVKPLYWTAVIVTSNQII